MGTYKRLPREKTKSSNEVFTWLEHAHHWFNINWRIVLAGIASVAILASIVYAGAGLLGGRGEKAKELLYKASKLTEGSEEQTAAYNELIQKYSRSNSAMVARLKLGDLYYSRGEYQKAAETYMPVASSGEPLLRITGMHNVASSKLAGKDAAGAADEYMKAYNDPKNLAKGISYFNAALAYKDAGNIDEAKKMFTVLLKDDTFSDPQLKDKSREQLLWISATTK